MPQKVEFKVAVAINYDTGLIPKLWIFADTGFGDNWPNELDVSIKSKLSLTKDGKLQTVMMTKAIPKKPIVLQTLHGIVRRDCSPEVIAFLESEMSKIAAKLDAEVQKLPLNQANPKE